MLCFTHQLPCFMWPFHLIPGIKAKHMLALWKAPSIHERWWWWDDDDGDGDDRSAGDAPNMSAAPIHGQRLPAALRDWCPPQFERRSSQSPLTLKRNCVAVVKLFWSFLSDFRRSIFYCFSYLFRKIAINSTAFKKKLQECNEWNGLWIMIWCIYFASEVHALATSGLYNTCKQCHQGSQLLSKLQ